MTHQSFGPLSPEDFAALRDLPPMRAAKVIQKFDPLWGKGYGEGQVRSFEVVVQQEVPSIERATVTVEATSVEEAEKLIDAMDWDKFKWDHYMIGDADHHEIIDTKVAP